MTTPPRGRRAAVWLAAALALLAAGCDLRSPGAPAREEDEPAFQRGRQLLRENRPEEAYDAFAEVVAVRPFAPESHLEAGLIALEVSQDPVTATYHFRRYLRLRPDGERAPHVRQLLETAAKQFARALPADPFGVGGERADLIERYEALQQDNARLRAALTEAAQTLTAQGLPAPALPAPVTPAVRVPPPPAPEPEPAPAVAGTAPPAPRSAPAAGGRTHAVAQGDNFYSIARRYGVSVAELQAANPGVDSTRLQIGQVLRLPNR